MGCKQSAPVKWAPDTPDCRDRFLSLKRDDSPDSPISNSWWKDDEEPSLDIGILTADELQILRHPCAPCAGFAVAASAHLCLKQREPLTQAPSSLFISKDASGSLSLRQALSTLRQDGACSALNYDWDTPFCKQSPFVEAEAFGYPTTSFYKCALAATDYIHALSLGMPVIFAMAYYGTDPRIIKIGTRAMRRALEADERSKLEKTVYCTAVIGGWCAKRKLFYGWWSSDSPDPTAGIVFTPSLVENVNQCTDAWAVCMNEEEVGGSRGP